jgi:hypothetical protein
MPAILKTTIIQDPSSATSNILLDSSGNVNLAQTSGNVNINTTGVAAKLYVQGNSASNTYALTDGATITPDFTQGNNFSVTLGGNRTMANPTSPTVGQSGVIYVTQDGTGSRTLAWGAYYKFPNGGGAPILTTTASAVDAFFYTVRSSTSITINYALNIG